MVGGMGDEEEILAKRGRRRRSSARASEII